MFNKIHRSLIAPFYLKRDNLDIFPILKEIEKTQYMSLEHIEKLQLKSLQKIITYASHYNPYYKKLFMSISFNPGDLKSLNDLKKLPVLTKDAVRRNKNDLISSQYNVENMVKKRTGGSTSIPIHLYVDNYAATFKYACTLRHNRWAGYDLGDKLAAIWGDTDKKLNIRDRLRRSLYDRVIYLDTLKMDEQYTMEFISKIRGFKPKILMGHAHSLFMFAEFVEEHGIEDLRIKGIISTAEMLLDNERRKIEDVFGNIVFNRYGCEELSIIASECKLHDGLHINADGLVVEIVNPIEGGFGKLIITDLVNTGMPFIRYEVGDMAKFQEGTCTCGRGLPRLEKIYGRISDFLYTPEGKMISGISILDTFTIHVPGIKQIQIEQVKIDELLFRVVRDSDFGEKSINILTEKVPRFFGSKMQYKIVFVDKIPQTERGKYRFSICKLSEEDLRAIKS